jgi:anti-sigma regulatory factor (Ser/Thr protein kinase)
VQVAAAGHPPGYVLRPDGELVQLRGKGPPLGVTRSAAWATETLEVEDGSRLVLYTDGLIERRDETLDAGFARLEQALVLAGADTPDLIAQELVAALRPDAGFGDDVAVLVCALGPVSPEPLEIELEAHPGSLAVARRAIARWLEANGVAPAEAYDAVLAVDESASNVIEHAYGPGEGTIVITAERHGSELRFAIRDRGGWRGPRGEHRGRGLPAMRRLMHEVDVETGQGGTHVRLVRRLGEPVSDG